MITRNCRFYAHAYTSAFGVIANPGSNQCALFTNSTTPCRMEACDLAPEETVCPYVTEVTGRLPKLRAGKVRTVPEALDAIMRRLSQPGLRLASPYCPHFPGPDGSTPSGSPSRCPLCPPDPPAPPTVPPPPRDPEL